MRQRQIESAIQACTVVSPAHFQAAGINDIYPLIVTTMRVNRHEGISRNCTIDRRKFLVTMHLSISYDIVLEHALHRSNGMQNPRVLHY
jgi:hypothetical protein